MGRTYSGIFLISAATLLFEIALTRVFSVLFFHHFAFLIISTALFGFGFSGLFLFYKKHTWEISNQLGAASLLFAISGVISYKIILLLPYRLQDISENPFFIVRLLVNYAMLVVPFFFSGYAIGLILSSFPEKAGKYYCFDLIGGAVGCIAVLWLVPLVGASGAIVVSALLAGLSALCFWPVIRWLRWCALLTSLATAILCTNAEDLFRLPLARIFLQKHGPFYGAPKRQVEYSAWSPVSRIDVLVTPPSRMIYLDGGSNVSFMVPFNGKYDQLQPRINWRAVPYLIAPRSKVCIIGPGGGEDVLMALSNKADSITAIEMDPLIVQIVQGKYRGFVGGIFNHPAVHLINDEGRSYLRRSEEQFDLIQSVHNCSPMAFASGALNLSESYLFTVEAFREYWQHLRPGGILAINRTGILRAASTASLVLQQEGIANPEDYVIVTSRRDGDEIGFYLKKGMFTERDAKSLIEAKEKAKIEIKYAPLPAYQREKNVWYSLLAPSLRRNVIRESDIVLEASTDNWPFFDHYRRWIQSAETRRIQPREYYLESSRRGDLALFALLVESLVLSFLFMLFPLLRIRRTQASIPGWAILIYFGALGAGFIMIEISLIQTHILFMGEPVYSITSVLFSLLLSAGMGSFVFQNRYREGKERFWIFLLACCLTLSLLWEFFLVPKLFAEFLGFDKVSRFLLSGLFILPLGFSLGMPFPFGIRILEKKAPDAIPWGWGLNAYTTVVGSVVGVIVALTWGFRASFLVSYLLYLSGLASLFYSLFHEKALLGDVS